MPTLLMVETTQVLAETRRCLAATHHRIALSRRLLNPAWGISGGSDVDLRLSIRDRLERGALSLGSRSVAARWGNGNVCVVCDWIIASTEIANGSLSDDGETVWYTPWPSASVAGGRPDLRGESDRERATGSGRAVRDRA